MSQRQQFVQEWECSERYTLVACKLSGGNRDNRPYGAQLHCVRHSSAFRSMAEVGSLNRKRWTGTAVLNRRRLAILRSH